MQVSLDSLGVQQIQMKRNHLSASINHLYWVDWEVLHLYLNGNI